MITILEVNRYANQFVEVGWSFLNSLKLPIVYCICMLCTSDRLERNTFMLSSLLYIVLTVDYNFQRPVDIFLISWFPKLLSHPKGNPVSITVYDITFESSVPGGSNTAYCM